MQRLVNYDFVPKIITSFQDYENIYLVTNIIEGKSVNHYKKLIMTEEQIKFISACVIQALVYLRKEKIIHRDIMMKNIIMDQDKYFNIIDFSSSIFYNDKNDSKKNMITYDMVTPPEILNNLNYDYNSDYYRLGCVLYYIIFKKHPLIVKRENNITDIIIDDKYTKNYTF